MFDKCKWALVDVKHINEMYFDMYEGKFLDMEDYEINNKERFVYVNISNFDSTSFAESDVRAYAYPYEDMYSTSEYELHEIEKCYGSYFKKKILEQIPKMEMEEDIPTLCGFVYRHGDKDFEAYQVELTKADREKIDEILSKYETDGCSTRNAYDSKISELF